MKNVEYWVFSFSSAPDTRGVVIRGLSWSYLNISIYNQVEGNECVAFDIAEQLEHSKQYVKQIDSWRIIKAYEMLLNDSRMGKHRMLLLLFFILYWRSDEVIDEFACRALSCFPRNCAPAMQAGIINHIHDKVLFSKSKNVPLEKFLDKSMNELRAYSEKNWIRLFDSLEEI